MIARRFEGGFLFCRAVPLGVRRRGSDELPWGPFSRRRRSERPSPGTFWGWTPGLFEADAYRFVYSQEPHTKGRKFFPVELRAKTFQHEDANGCDNSYGKTTAEMHQQSTFQGWDFINVWAIGENQTYPYLRTVPAGDINKDRIVNFLDLCIISEQWMEEE